VRAANRATDAVEKRSLAESLRAGGWLLGLLAADPGEWFATGKTGGGEDAEIDSLVARRDALRRERNFKEADRIRQELADRGIVIEDVAGGARWRRTR
jgi:cysteinyl-tRNA synthetase